MFEQGLCLEDGVHSVDDSIGCSHIKEDDVSTAGTGLQLDELVPGDVEVLTVGCLDGGGAGGEVLAGHGGAGDDVSQQHRLELLLVLSEAFQVVLNWIDNERCLVYFVACLHRGC